MPKFKTGDKIALAKVEYRTVLEIVEASEHEYYIKRPYRPFESSILSHSVYDIDNNYELVQSRESEPEISTVVDPDGFDIDDPESPINAIAQLQQKVDVLVGLVERAYREGWGEAAPKIPHVSSIRVDKDWDNSYTKDELAVIKEEFDEFWEEMRKKNPDRENMKMELIQVAATAIRAAVDCGLMEANGRES